MLSKVEVYDLRNNLLSLPMNGVGSSFKVRDITGLGPIKASVVSSTMAGRDGSVVQGIQGGDRNIVLTLGLEPDYATESVSGLRDVLYAFFMSKASVRLRFFSTDRETVEIVGVVESCDPAIFSQTAEMKISILCSSPAFYSLAPITVNGTTAASSAEGVTVTEIVNPGSLECGYILVLTETRDDTGYAIMNWAPNKEVLQVAATMPNGSSSEVSTIAGAKYVQVRNAGIVTDWASGISANSVWPLLKPGVNYFKVYVGALGHPWVLTYTPLYGGL